MAYYYNGPVPGATPATGDTVIEILGTAAGWCIVIILALWIFKSTIIAFFKAGSDIEMWKKRYVLMRDFDPRSGVEGVPAAERLSPAGGVETQEAVEEVGRILMPGIEFGKKSMAERMQATIERDHPELAPRMVRNKAGRWQIEINDTEA